MPDQPRRTRILDYLLITLALPVMVWVELNEASEDISLALTGGKYSGYGRLNRKRYYHDDESDYDWLRPADYHPDKFHSAIWRAQHKQYIEKRLGPRGLPELVLTREGEAKVFKRFPLLKLAHRVWKGWWLVVSFDIPETEKTTRESIRRQLTSIGFGQWQKSVYVSPHDIADDLAKLLKNNRLEDKVVPMLAKRILSGNDWEFARRIFHIDEIETEYQKIIDSLKPTSKPNLNHRDFLRRQFSRYIEIIRGDPLLPIGLAPKDGYGRERALLALQSYAAAIKHE